MVLGGPYPKPKSHKQIVRDFLRIKEVPAWFRGNSDFQTQAIGSLWYSIRDDIAQETSYRTYANLAAIGLKPMIKPSQVKKLLQFCRGSDIFFLWSLKELYYKSPKPNTYSVNEQLIMSAIARLDMITTLRGLDKILPPPQPTKTEIRRKKLEEIRQKEEELKRCRATKAKAKRNLLNEYGKAATKSPYFIKQPRPKPQKRILYSDPPDYKVSLGHYKVYQNKYYRVRNEQTRWFADYKLQPGKRIAKGVIEEQIDNMFNLFDSIKIKADTVHQLCEHHKELKELEESMKMKMQALIQEKFEGYFDTKAKKKEALAKVIRAQMEKDQSAFLCKFRRLAEQTSRKYTVLVLKNNVEYECRCVELDSEDSMECIPLPDCPSCTRRPYNEDILEECDEDNNGKMRRISYDHKSSDKPTQLNNNHKPRHESDSRSNNNNGLENIRHSRTNFNQKDLIYKDEKEQKRLLSSNFSRRYVAAYDFGGHPERTSPTPSNTFFTAPVQHLPHNFDYRKIFHYKDNNPSKIDIRKAFVDAINNDINKLIQLQQEKEKPPCARNANVLTWEQNGLKRTGEWEKPNVGLAVKECIRKTFLEGAKAKGKEIAAKEAEEKRKQQAILENKRSLGTIFREKFNQEYYDPDDQPLMHAMLKYALELLARDPKYVLPALPDAHMLSFLREFIYLRYGKVYKKSERFDNYRQCFKLLIALEKGSLKVPLPSEREMGTKRYTSYKCEKYIRRKARSLKNRFNENFDEAIMDEARVIWFAMRPYLCGLPPRKTFFAYMPESKNLIKRFKVWNPREFIDARAAFEKRWAEKQGRETR